MKIEDFRKGVDGKWLMGDARWSGQATAFCNHFGGSGGLTALSDDNYSYPNVNEPLITGDPEMVRS